MQKFAYILTYLGQLGLISGFHWC